MPAGETAREGVEEAVEEAAGWDKSLRGSQLGGSHVLGVEGGRGSDGSRGGFCMGARRECCRSHASSDEKWNCRFSLLLDGGPTFEG